MAVNIGIYSWFLGYDILFEFVFAVISLILSIFAFRIYRITSETKSKLFGISFLLISISYFLQSMFNFLASSSINNSICAVTSISTDIINYYGNYAHFLFMIVGLATLLYMTFNIKHPEVLAFLVILSISSFIMSNNIFYTFYLLSTIYLVFITWHFVKNYFYKKQKLSLLVALAFSFLLFGSIHFFLSVDHQLFYIIGHFLELTAYILLLINFYMVQKK